MDEEAPPVGADQPLDRHATAVRAELVASLPVAHAIDRAPAIELRAAFAEPEKRALCRARTTRRARPRRTLSFCTGCPETVVTSIAGGSLVNRTDRLPAVIGANGLLRAPARQRCALPPHATSAPSSLTAPPIGTTVIRIVDGPIPAIRISTAWPAIDDRSGLPADNPTGQHHACPGRAQLFQQLPTGDGLRHAGWYQTCERSDDTMPGTFHLFASPGAVA